MIDFNARCPTFFLAIDAAAFRPFVAAAVIEPAVAPGWSDYPLT